MESRSQIVAPAGVPTAAPQRRAFTLVELLVVITVLAALSLLMAPLLAQNRTTTHAFVCQNNLKQLLSALRLYAADNLDYLPANFENGGIRGQWVSGDVSNPNDATNSDLLINPRYAQLARYTGAKPQLYRCPADPGTVTSGNLVLPRVRSISMNCAVGTYPGMLAPTESMWLVNSKWRTYGRMAQMVAPNPAGLFIFCEEDPGSINDMVFAQTMDAPQWVDFPATFHNYAGTFGFADGHSEVHQWVENSTKFPPPTPHANITGTTNDIVWFQRHESALIY